MPNHITNKLKLIGNKEEVKKVLDFIKDDESEYGIIDFNKITPMPKWVFSENLGQKEREKYGEENCWLDWCRNNWGTKWNAYSQEFNELTNTITFDTAWNGVPELMSKLAWIFPNVTFEYCYADEDIGSNVGKYTFKDTEVLGGYIESDTKESYDLAFEIKGISPKEYGYVFNEEINKYEYQEEE